MAKIDLTSLEWRELIFQGKNKGYGAYTLRAESNKRHNVAMIIITIVVLLVFSLPKLIDMVKPKQREIITEVTTLSALEKPEVKNDIKKVGPAEPPPALKSSIKFTAPIIKKDEEVNDDDEMKSQEELNRTSVAISIADVKGNDDVNGKDIADIKENVTQEVAEKVWDVIEQMPQFPGGDDELMKFLSSNIKYPVVAQENGIEGRVILQFVVSKIGVISDVVVVRSLDPSCDKEAVRVVKMLPNWIPGKQNGVNVNVKYTLPVSFKLQK
ncbi:MAG: TonB family protein [Paludibacter sp.]|nr:TonB family protein [Paludibacter sp.]